MSRAAPSLPLSVQRMASCWKVFVVQKSNAVIRRSATFQSRGVVTSLKCQFEASKSPALTWSWHSGPRFSSRAPGNPQLIFVALVINVGCRPLPCWCLSASTSCIMPHARPSQAQHKAEGYWPSRSGKWFLLKCELHTVYCLLSSFCRPTPVQARIKTSCHAQGQARAQQVSKLTKSR